MQTVQKDRETGTNKFDGKIRRIGIQMPDRGTLIGAGIVTGGAIAASLAFTYYLRRRNKG